jgi:hypothetical protein
MADSIVEILRKNFAQERLPDVLVEGDCINCGGLCQPGIYCCPSPSPLTKEEVLALNRERRLAVRDDDRLK